MAQFKRMTLHICEKYYCKFGNLQGFIFVKTSQMRSFLKTNSSGNGEIILSFTDIGKSCPRHEF